MNARIKKEIENGYKSKEFKFFFDVEGLLGDPNLAYIKFLVKTGLYQGQTHILRIKFIYNDNQPYIFPKDPPNIIFLTPIYHTNISESGGICLDVIKSDKWSPLYGLETIFISIIALLEDPNTSSPYNSEASRQYVICQKEKTLETNYKKICDNYYYSKLLYNEHVKKIINTKLF